MGAGLRRFRRIPGVGKAIAEKITELPNAGDLAFSILFQDGVDQWCKRQPEHQ
jgi:DNA polymerase/3'-5' exonuclease PolX